MSRVHVAWLRAVCWYSRQPGGIRDEGNLSAFGMRVSVVACTCGLCIASNFHLEEVQGGTKVW